MVDQKFGSHKKVGTFILKKYSRTVLKQEYH